MKYWLMHLPDCDAEIVAGPARLMSFHDLGRALDEPEGALLYRVVVPAKRAGKRIFKIVPALYALREGGGCQIKLSVKGRLIEFEPLDGSHRIIMDISRLQPDYFKEGFCYIDFLDPDQFVVEARAGEGYWLTGVSLLDDRQLDEPVRIAEKIPGGVVAALSSAGDPFSVFVRFPDDPVKDMALAEVAKDTLGSLYASSDQRGRAKKWRKVHPERVRVYVEKIRTENAGRLPHGWKKTAMRRFGMTLKTLNRYLDQLGLS